MDNEKQPENKSPEQQNKKPVKQHRAPRAAIIWLVILLVLGGLLLFRDSGSSRKTELNQTEFEQSLAAGKIVSAVLVNENDNVFTVEGRIKLTGIDSKNSKDGTGFYRSRVIFSEKLNNLLSKTSVKVSSNNNGLWNFLLMGILPVLLIVGVIYFISMRQMRNGQGAMDFGKSKARMIPPDELNVKFSDIAGADEAKEEIREIVEYLRDPIRFQLIGGRIPKGCLLVGNPGTGKTLMAKAVACEAGVPFFSISGSDFVEMFVGVGASRVRDMFNQARKHTPCLIFIDEIDAVGRSRFSGWGGGHDEREQTLNAMLVEMDGLESRNGVIVLAATNRPDVLDPALLRPGRFDRQVVMDLPDIAGRKQILEVHIKRIKVADDIDLDVIARTTPGFSGADLANVCNEAALLAARRDKEAVSQSELEEARDKVNYGTERRSRKITERERVLTAYHEAGHALVALHDEHCTPVHKVTIIPRGQAYLGATFTMPKEDVYTRSKLELEAEMAMCMGGRAAEELTMGDITTGASADIQHLTAIARKMVCMFGMTDIIGPTQVGDFSIHPHLRIDGPTPDQLAPETAREIDLEIRRLVNTALDKARNCLTEHRDELEKLAQALLEKETLSIDEIDVLLGRKPAPEAESPEVETEIAENADDSDGTSAAAEADL
ncbi:MAG: ATP-dependent zinc metalloprotease FtsH [Lentisphaeria bacterium]|nr:ATP-dependent zinc metalloprotease FtsH [Lentisphaeria bacterium]